MTNDKAKDARQNKRAKFEQAEPKLKFKSTLYLLAGGGILVAALLAWLWWGHSTPSVAEAGELPAVQDGAYKLPTALFDDGMARTYGAVTVGVR